MRTFSSYGPIDQDLHFHVPREELIESAYRRLIGENPEKGGHYITVWAPRQAGKTWIMHQVEKKFWEQGDFEVAIISMQSAKTIKTGEGVLKFLVKRLGYWFDRKLPQIDSWENLADLFTKKWFEKPLILESYTNERGYNEALLQAARYGKQLKLSEISLFIFVEAIDDANRAKFEKDYKDEETGVNVLPVFVETGA